MYGCKVGLGVRACNNFHVILILQARVSGIYWSVYICPPVLKKNMHTDIVKLSLTFVLFQATRAPVCSAVVDRILKKGYAK